MNRRARQDYKVDTSPAHTPAPGRLTRAASPAVLLSLLPRQMAMERPKAAGLVRWFFHTFRKPRPPRGGDGSAGAAIVLDDSDDSDVGAAAAGWGVDGPARLQQSVERRMVPGPDAPLLLCATCRAAGLPARLVRSLQPVPMKRASSKRARGGSKKRHGDMQDGPPGKQKRGAGKEKAMAAPPAAPGPSDSAVDQWLEVHDGGQWCPVDCENGGLVEDRRWFEQRATQPVHCVLAVRAEGLAQDVTEFYASDFYGGGAVRLDEAWWHQLLSEVPKGVQRDAPVDGAPLFAGVSTALDDRGGIAVPGTFAELKGHRVYVAQRHIGKRERVATGVKPAGFVKGEPVYLRSTVQPVRTAAQWRRIGRMPADGAQPIDEQGGFGQWQTTTYVPKPVVDGASSHQSALCLQCSHFPPGRVPVNEFGNVELFEPWMLPPGGRHLMADGAAATAALLGISHARAVVGYEMHRGKAAPAYNGVVVPEEAADLLLMACAQRQHAKAEDAAEARSVVVLSRWKRLLQRLFIHARLSAAEGRE